MATDNIDPTVRDRLSKIEMDIATLFNRKPRAASTVDQSGLAAVEYVSSTHTDLSVASGAFPATPSAALDFTPTRDCPIGIGFLSVQVGFNVSGGTSDFGCNIGMDTGGGFGFQWICSIGNTRLYNPPGVSSGGIHLSMQGFKVGMSAGQLIRFRHEFYNADIYGAGSVAMESQFTFVAFATTA